MMGEQEGAAGPQQLFCTATGGVLFFEVAVSAAALDSAPSGSLSVGPLLPGEVLACALAPNSAPSNRTTTCSASFQQLRAPVLCPTANGAPSYELQCDDCAPRAPSPLPGPVLCANHTTLVTARGSFTDGTLPGGRYGPSSTCSWLIQPGYAFIRLNFTSFDTEDGFDSVYIMAVHNNGFTEVVRQLSGSPQVRSAAVLLAWHLDSQSSDCALISCGMAA